MIDIFAATSIDAIRSSNWGEVLDADKSLYKVHLIKPEIDYSALEADDMGDIVCGNEIFDPTLLDSDGIFDFNDSRYIKSLSADYSKVLDNPDAIFILDIPDNEAIKVSSKYGVICQSTKAIDAKALMGGPIIRVLAENESRHSWDSIMPKKLLPSNSIIIIDRNLFANDKINDNEYDADKLKYAWGAKNLYTILEKLLPFNLSETNDYYITIFTDAKKRKDANGLEDWYVNGTLTCKQLVSMLKNVRNQLKNKRNFRIHIEVIVQTSNSPFHEITHNRRIISNYYYFTADHKFCAFKFSDGLPTCNQKICYFPLLSNFENEDSDVATYEHQQLLKLFSGFVKSLLVGRDVVNNINDSRLSTECRVYVAGRGNSTPNDLGNRMLRYN